MLIMKWAKIYYALNIECNLILNIQQTGYKNSRKGTAFEYLKICGENTFVDHEAAEIITDEKLTAEEINSGDQM